jgi:hypothetical protein
LQSHVSSNRDKKITKSKHDPLPEIALYDKNVDIKFSAFIYLICCKISIYLKVDFEIMKMKYDNNSISISIGLSGWKSVWLKVFNATFTNISAI